MSLEIEAKVERAAAKRRVARFVVEFSVANLVENGDETWREFLSAALSP